MDSQGTQEVGTGLYIFVEKEKYSPEWERKDKYCPFN